jgi:hypothetical protein
MRSLLLIPVVAIVAALTTGPAGATTTGACTSGHVLKTKSYVFAFSLGSPETMYTRAQVKAKHPTNGEVMLSGSMTGMSGMHMPGTQYHLEVHICTAAGAVVTGAHPKIVVTDNSAKTVMMTNVPIATMQGVGMGLVDYHYGNNVALTAGHKITVTVSLKGESAVFRTTVTKSHAMAMG